ncbi:MAG: hypothetical protein IPK80_34970 [Nannocystis sp.]|nr:hypothetical protein [Nannocystis sp.]
MSTLPSLRSTSFHLERADLTNPKASIERQQDDDQVLIAERCGGEAELGDLIVAVDRLLSRTASPQLLDLGDRIDQPHPLGDAEHLGETTEDPVGRFYALRLTQFRAEGHDPILVDRCERQGAELRP